MYEWLLLLFNEKKWLRFNEKKERKREEVNNKKEFSLIITNFILHEILTLSLFFTLKIELKVITFLVHDENELHIFVNQIRIKHNFELLCMKNEN